MIVGQLLAAVADIDAVTNDSWTALHEASLNGHTAVVERLLQAGAQVRQLHPSQSTRALSHRAFNAAMVARQACASRPSVDRMPFNAGAGAGLLE